MIPDDNRHDGMRKEERDIREETEALVARAQAGDMKAAEDIIHLFREDIRSKASSYYIIGADRDDVIQEAMIGLYKAIRTYSRNGGAGFRTYANVCMTRQIITAVRRASREKHEPLNSSVSISNFIESGDGAGGGATLEETLEGNAVADADTLLVLNDIMEYIENDRSAFTDLEAAVWKEFMAGRSYEETAVILGKNVKSVYNAMNRVKKKIMAFINE